MSQGKVMSERSIHCEFVFEKAILRKVHALGSMSIITFILLVLNTSLFARAQAQKKPAVLFCTWGERDRGKIDYDYLRSEERR